MDDLHEQMEEDMAAAYSNPITVATELLHRAAFTGGLSNPLLPDASAVSSLTTDTVYEFLASWFKAGNMAIAAAGMGLNELKNVSGFDMAPVGCFVGCIAVVSTTLHFGTMLSANRVACKVCHAIQHCLCCTVAVPALSLTVALGVAAWALL